MNKLTPEQKKDLHRLLKLTVLQPSEVVKVLEYYIYVRKGVALSINIPTDGFNSNLLEIAFEAACNWFGDNFKSV